MSFFDYFRKAPKTATLAKGKTLDSHAAQIILEQYFGEKAS